MRTRLLLPSLLLSAEALLLACPAEPQIKKVDTLLCRLDVLPQDFQIYIEKNFSSWKVQEASNLTASARGRWKAEKPLACPGIAVGEFETPGKPSYAVLLVPKSNPDSAYKLLIQSPSLPDRVRTLEEWDKGQASNYFIHAIPIAKVFSKDWIRRLDTATKDGILAAEAGTKEYGIDVYFWSKGQFRHEPIDY